MHDEVSHVILYAAKSTADEHGSIDSQLDACRDYGTRRGWTIVDEFSDEAASAFRGSRGPGLAAAKARAAEAAAESADVALLVFASDRLARGDGTDGAHLVEHLLDARRAGYALASVTENLSDELGLAMVALLGDRAHLDSKAKSEHVRRGKRAAAARGRRNGGPRPYGYRHVAHIDAESGKPVSRLEIVAAEAAIVRRVFRAYLEGQTQSAIARSLARDGIKTSRGGAWTQSQVSALLRSRLYLGEVSYRSEWFPGEHEPIVDAAVFESAQGLLGGAPIHRGGRPSFEPFLLGRGLLRCGCCGSTMRVRTKPESTRVGKRWRAFYRCTGRESGSQPDCRMPAVSRDDVDPAVFAFFERVGLDFDAMRSQVTDRIGEIRTETRALDAQATAELLALDAKRERIERDYLSGDLPAHLYAELSARLDDERAAASAQAERLRQRLCELDEEEATLGDDAAADALARIADLRAAVAGAVRDADSVEAASQALRTIFEGFVLHDRRLAGVPWVREPDLTVGDLYIEPLPRPEVVLGGPLVQMLDEDGNVRGSSVPPLVRTTITEEREPQQSSR